MKKAEFLPSLYTHNAIIDAQHQELINTINKLYEAIDSGKGTDEAKNALAFLMQYTVFHFGGEAVSYTHLDVYKRQGRHYLRRRFHVPGAHYG